MLKFRTPDKVYFKKGCLPVALNELKYELKKSRALIVTDSNLYRNGYVDILTNLLNEIGVSYSVFSDSCALILTSNPPENGYSAIDEIEGCYVSDSAKPNLFTVQAGAGIARKQEPDILIAFGGGSVIDATKVIKLLYENPDANIPAIAEGETAFPPKKGKAYFIAIPTTSGKGSEVSPFAEIAEVDKTYQLASYELLPDMAIIDADVMATMPPELTAKSGISALYNAVYANISSLSTDYTEGLAERAMDLIFRYLPDAVANGNNMQAREKMATASVMAGMAFGNACLGAECGEIPAELSGKIDSLKNTVGLK